MMSSCFFSPYSCPFYLTQLLEGEPVTFAFGQRVLFMCFDNWTVRKMTDHVDFLASCAKLSWQGKSLYKLKSPKGLPHDFHILGRGFYPHDIHSMGNPAISSEVTYNHATIIGTQPRGLLATNNHLWISYTV
jgi:hypothetical protein